MASLSVGDILTIAEKVHRLYKKYEEADEQIKRVGEEIDNVSQYLDGLGSFLNDYQKRLSSETPKEYKSLKTFLSKIENDSREVLAILKEFDRNNKNKWEILHKIGFIWGSSNPEALRILHDRISTSFQWVSHWFNLLQSRMLGGMPQPVLSEKPVGKVAPQSQSILFLDNYDIGRAVVGWGYARLLQQWTLLTGNFWPLSVIHSAGVRTQGTGSVLAAQQFMDIRNLEDRAGQWPLTAALNALYDNKFFDYDYKKKQWNEAKDHRARPLYNLGRGAYENYKWVIVFDDSTKRAFDRLTRRLEEQKQAGPLKGKLVHLATYHPDSAVRQINSAKVEGKDAKERWEKTVAQIKLAFRNFLEQEFGWQKPS